MLDHFLKSMQGVVEDYTPRRLLYVAMLVLGVAYMEWLTGFFFNWNYERKVEVLRKLHELSKDGISQDPQLAAVYQELLSQINVYRPAPLFLIPGGTTVTELFKFAAASIVWYAVAVGLYVYGKRKHPSNWKFAVIATTVVGTIFGLVGLLIPTLGHVVVNALIYLLIAVGAVFLLYRAGRRVGAAQAALVEQT